MTWHFASVLNWIWRCCISTHLTFQVSQGSAATDLRWGENVNKFLFRNSLLNIVVKKLWKSVNICQSYWKNKSVLFFYGPQCRYPWNLVSIWYFWPEVVKLFSHVHQMVPMAHEWVTYVGMHANVSSWKGLLYDAIGMKNVWWSLLSCIIWLEFMRSFNNIKVWLFCMFGLKTPIHAPKMFFSGRI